MCEMRMVKSDGEIFWVRLDATMAQDSNMIGLFAACL